jgi:hypothetical protein
MSEITAFVISAVIVGLWMYGLWKFSHARKKTGRRNFYLLFFLPLILLAVIPLVGGGFFGILTADFLGFVYLTAIILYMGLWSVTLYEIGGNDELVWFILVAIPPLSALWILYRIVKIR